MTTNDIQKWVSKASFEKMDRGLFHEEVWNQVAGFAQLSPWSAKNIPWVNVEKHQEVFRRLGKWKFIEEFRVTHPNGFPSAHPPAGNSDGVDDWIPSVFSPHSALARAKSIYSMAIMAYQNIVRRYFPKFVNELRYSAWWPYRLVGIVENTTAGAQYSNWSVHYHCEPLQSESDSVAEFTLGTRDDYRGLIDIERLHQQVVRMRQSASPWFWGISGGCKLHDSHPAAGLVKDWLLSDLRDAGWKV